MLFVIWYKTLFILRMLKNANMAKARNRKIYLNYGLLKMTLHMSLNM